MDEKKILKFAKKQGYRAIKQLKDWNEYKVYEPLMDLSGRRACIGLPFVILVKGDKIRMSTKEEAFKIIDDAT